MKRNMCNEMQKDKYHAKVPVVLFHNVCAETLHFQHRLAFHRDTVKDSRVVGYLMCCVYDAVSLEKLG